MTTRQEGASALSGAVSLTSLVQSLNSPPLTMVDPLGYVLVDRLRTASECWKEYFFVKKVGSMFIYAVMYGVV